MDPRKLGQMLLGEWDKTKQPIKERATMLPLGQYEDGSVGLAWPGIIADPIQRGYEAANTPIPAINDDAAWADKSAAMFDAASLAPIAGLGMTAAGVGTPRGAIGSAGGRLTQSASNLPMDLASRMARAREMGFDTETPLYHGGKDKFDEFDVSKAGSVQYSDWGPGVYFTPSKDTANYYRAEAVKRGKDEYNSAYERWEALSKDAPIKNGSPQYSEEARAALKEFQRIGRELMKTDEGNVIKAFTRLKNPYVLPYQSTPDPYAAKRAMERGHDGIHVLNGGGGLDEVVVFDPRNIRSVNAAFDPARSDSANLLAANAKEGALPGLVANALDQPQGIRAYHGSPHDFDRFDLSKIGTGEGAQAYGHGLYFADSEDVARSYRDALSGADGMVKRGGLPISSEAGKLALLSSNGDIDKAIASVEGIVKSGGKHAEMYQGVLDELVANRDSIASAVKDPGRMYEVNIKANPEDFLDWDKAIGDVNALNKAFSPRDAGKIIKDWQKATGMKWDGNFYEQSGSGLLSVIDDAYGKGSAVRMLKEKGIPGIKYLDAGSRDAGTGTSNYVVFDDQLIDILRKYANAPTGSLPGLAAQAGDDYSGLGGIEMRRPYPSEDNFFKSSPHVAGMATEDNKIALNPYSNLTDEQRAAVAKNEAARVWMRRPEWAPKVDLTPEQAQKFSTYGQPLDQRSTVIARILSGDTSAGMPTQQQLEFAQRLASGMSRHDIDRQDITAQTQHESPILQYLRSFGLY